MGFAQRSAPPALLVKKDATGEGIYASRCYRPGDVVFRFEEVEWRAQRDLNTVQHPGGGHFFHRVLAKTAHSCEPNCCVSFPNRSMVAIRPIAAGEAITYDYQSTERWFSHPFWCLCGSRRCRGRIG
jgi:uncharacterized protein